jgi:hypothetical protein
MSYHLLGSAYPRSDNAPAVPVRFVDYKIRFQRIKTAYRRKWVVRI